MQEKAKLYAKLFYRGYQEDNIEYNEEKMEVKISGDFHFKESTHSKYNYTAPICAVNENHFFSNRDTTFQNDTSPQQT